MEKWVRWVIIIILFIVLGVVAVAIWWFFFRPKSGPSIEACVGQKDLDGLCCTSSQLSADDYKEVKDACSEGTRPTSLNSVQEEVNAAKFLLGLYQKLIDGEEYPLLNRGNFQYNNRSISDYFTAETKNGTDLFIMLYQLKTYNEIYDTPKNSKDLELLGVSYFNSLFPRYCIDVADSLYIDFVHKFDRQTFNNIYILAENDSILNAINILDKVTHNDYFVLSKGEVAIMTNNNDAVNYNVRVVSYPNDPYIKLLESKYEDRDLYTMPVFYETPVLEYNCLGDYRETPYYFKFLSKAPP